MKRLLVVAIPLLAACSSSSATSPPANPPVVTVAPAAAEGMSFWSTTPSPTAAPAKASSSGAWLSGTMGEKPWTAKRAFLVRLNEGALASTSNYPGQQFNIVQSTIYAFEDDVTCDELPYRIFPTRWKAGQRYLEIEFIGQWPFPTNESFKAGRTVDKPTDLHVRTSTNIGGSYTGQGFTGPVRVVSSGKGRTVLDLDLHSPNRFGATYGDLRGQLEVIDCVKQPSYAKPKPATP